MPSTIRPATPEDSVQWAQLLHKTLGPEYGSKEIYDAAWCSAQVINSEDQETWVAEDSGRLQAAVSILKPAADNSNPILYLGRHLLPAESFTSRAAEELLRRMVTLADTNGHAIVARVSAFDHSLQALHENLGFVCAGYQPFKHSLPRRTAMLFYVRPSAAALSRRLPITEAPPQVGEIALKVLEALRLRDPLQVREGASTNPVARSERPAVSPGTSATS